MSEELEISKVVNVDSVKQNDHDSVGDERSKGINGEDREKRKERREKSEERREKREERRKKERPVATQFHSLDLGAKLEFCNAFVLIIVPDEDLVVGKSFVVFASNEGQNVASKQHLHNPNPTLKLCIED